MKKRVAKKSIKKVEKRRGLIIALIVAEAIIFLILLAVIQYTKPEPIKGLDAELASIGIFAGENVSESVNLATSSRKLYFMDAINSARTTITSSELPTPLADGTFEDLIGTRYTYNQQIILGDTITAFGISGGDLEDPILYLDAGTTATGPLYNYTLSFNRNLNVSSPNVQGQAIKILGRDFFIGAGSSNTTLNLYRDALRLYLNRGESKDIVLGRAAYTIGLVATTSEQSAVISVNGETRTLTEGSVYYFGGIIVYVKEVIHPSFVGDTEMVELIVGAELLKLENGKRAKKGIEETSIKETNVKIDAAEHGVISRFTVQVAMASSELDHIAAGESFTDPVFEGVSLLFSGETPSLDSGNRAKIKVNTDNSRFGYVAFTSARAGSVGEQTITYVYDNDTSDIGVQPLLAHQTIASADKGRIHVLEGENAKEDDWYVVNQGDSGTILEIEDIEQDPDALTIDVTLTDAITSVSETKTLSNATGGFTKEVSMFGGTKYTIHANRAGTAINITWEGTTATTVFPRIKLNNSGWIAFLTEAIVNDGTEVILPDGQTAIATSGIILNTGTNAYAIEDGVTWITRDNNERIEIYGIDINNDGEVDCNFDSENGPAILFMEPKKWDDDFTGDFICIPLTMKGAAEIAIGLPLFSGENSGFVTLGWDTYQKRAVDKYGTLVTYEDRANENGVAAIAYPNNQMYFDIYLRYAPQVTCTDSDGGLNYNVRGTTTGCNWKGECGDFTDYCEGNSVIEYLCYNNEVSIDTYTQCENGCQDGACVEVPGADPAIYSVPPYPVILTVNEENWIPLTIFNEGTETATNVNVYLYKLGYNDDWSVKYELVDSAFVGSVGLGERKETNLTYTPTELSSLEFYVNISSDSDVNENNNWGYFHVRVVRDETDVKLTNFDIYNQIPIVGENTAVWTEIENLGINVPSAQLNLYDNGVLVNSQDMAISQDYYREIKGIQWVPSSNGEHTLTVKIVAPGDVNLSDNQLEKTYHAYEKINVTVKVKDNQNNPVTRYIYSPMFPGSDDDYPIKIEGEKTLVAGNLSETGETFELGVYQIDGDYHYDISGGLMLMLVNSSFNENINIISEVYNKTTDDERDYYVVFANRISTALSSVFYGMAFNKSYLKKLGVENISKYSGEEGESLTGDYDFVYCPVFDFANKKCAGIWKKAIASDIDEEEGEVIVIVGGANYTVEAFGLTSFIGFDGNTTNVSAESDVINNFTIERIGYGKIKFRSPINISRFKLNEDLLTDYVRIGIGKIKVDTAYLPELTNKTAELTFWNINLHNPQILYNGQSCSSSICTNKTYNSSSKTFKMDVAAFSYFEIVEGPYCGDGTCQGSIGENCSSCSDCACSSTQTCVNGACQTQADEDDDNNAGNNGGTPDNRCTPLWNCTWSLCAKNIQTYNCVDRNKCGTTAGRPSNHGTTKACLINKNCTDADKDGYGIGKDCLGPDINDNDATITNILRSEDAKTQDTAEDKVSEFLRDNLFEIVISLIILAFIIAILIIIIVLINAFKKAPAQIEVYEKKKKED